MSMWLYSVTVCIEISIPQSLLERGLIRDGGLFTKSNDKDIDNRPFSSFTRYFAELAYNFMSQIHKFDTTRISSLQVSKFTQILVQLNRWSMFDNLWSFIQIGKGLDRKRTLFRILAWKGEGLTRIREGLSRERVKQSF